MSDPITAGGKVVREWEQAIHDLATLEYQAADDEIAYRIARAEAFAAATGTVAAREKQVDKATAEASRKRLKSAADVRVHNQRLIYLREKLGFHRSEIATDRALSGVGT